MTSDECLSCIINDLIEGQLTTAEIVDKYCVFASSELRDLLISDLEEAKHLYRLKKILND